MTRTATLVAITLISALATPVVVHATTAKAPGAAAESAVAVVVGTKLQSAEPSCVRQVRVVYAGHGEGQGAPCTVLVR